MQLITIFEIHDVLWGLRPIEAMDNEGSFMLGNESGFDKSLWFTNVHYAAALLFSVGVERTFFGIKLFGEHEDYASWASKR